MEKHKVDMELIRRYIRGELTPREMYALERQAQADPTLMDIILGMEQEALVVHDDNLADIRKRIADRTGQRQATTRRLATVQRWAIAASILAVLSVGTWWFAREGHVEKQHEAAVATISAEAPEETPESGPSPRPIASVTDSKADSAPQRALEAPAAAVAKKEKEVSKEERLAVVTPKADTGLLDQVVVVGYGAQPQSNLTGAVARVAEAEIDTTVSSGEPLLAARSDGIRVHSVSARQHAVRPSVTEQEITENPHQPKPKTGWVAYRQYLREAVKPAPRQGTVALTFRVDDDGRPTGIAVVETTNEQLNKFAILVVRDGPLWLPGTNGGRDVTLRVVF